MNTFMFHCPRHQPTQQLFTAMKAININQYVSTYIDFLCVEGYHFTFSAFISFIKFTHKPSTMALFSSIILHISMATKLED